MADPSEWRTDAKMITLAADTVVVKLKRNLNLVEFVVIVCSSSVQR